ncbi:MAG: phosphoribosylformylglycinamidine cyclo-ligase [Planctomycetota bacterium]
MTERMTYKNSGVDIEAGNKAVRKIKESVMATYTPRVFMQSHGAFGGMFALDFDKKRNGLFRRNYRDPVLIGCTDGVGTKLKIAFKMGIHNTVGIDLVAMSVNDLIVQGGEPLFFLDYIAVAKLDANTIAEIVSGVSKGCVEAECALLGGETAELPGFYKKGEYDLAGFAVGVVEKRKVVTGSLITAGDIVIGLESSGLHSNGYSLARRVFEKAKWRMTKFVPEFGCQLGKELLRPTRIYVKSVLSVLKKYTYKIIKGMVNITGGAYIDKFPRVLPADCSIEIDTKSWEVPPVFRVMQKLGDIEKKEMYHVFNMGIGYAVIIHPSHASNVIRRLKKTGCQAHVIGKIVPGDRSVKLL